MLDGLMQQLAGGTAESMGGSQLFNGVAQMMEGNPNEHGIGAISQALGTLGGSGFGQSVAEGSQNWPPHI